MILAKRRAALDGRTIKERPLFVWTPTKPIVIEYIYFFNYKGPRWLSYLTVFSQHIRNCLRKKKERKKEKIPFSFLNNKPIFLRSSIYTKAHDLLDCKSSFCWCMYIVGGNNSDWRSKFRFFVIRIYSLYTSDEKKKTKQGKVWNPGVGGDISFCHTVYFFVSRTATTPFFLFGDAALLREREATSADDKTRKHTQTHQTDKNWCNGRLAFSGCCTYRRARCQERKLGYRGARSSVYALSYARQTI